MRSRNRPSTFLMIALCSSRVNVARKACLPKAISGVGEEEASSLMLVSPGTLASLLNSMLKGGACDLDRSNWSN